jgi:hypothetical protein
MLNIFERSPGMPVNIDRAFSAMARSFAALKSSPNRNVTKTQIMSFSPA